MWSRILGPVWAGKMPLCGHGWLAQKLWFTWKSDSFIPSHLVGTQSHVFLWTQHYLPALVYPLFYLFPQILSVTSPVSLFFPLTVMNYTIDFFLTEIFPLRLWMVWIVGIGQTDRKSISLIVTITLLRCSLPAPCSSLSYVSLWLKCTLCTNTSITLRCCEWLPNQLTCNTVRINKQ